MSPFDANEQFRRQQEQMRRQREIQEQQKRHQDMVQQQQEQFRKQQQQFQDQMRQAAWRKKMEEENQQKQIQKSIQHAKNRNQQNSHAEYAEANFPTEQPQSQGSSCLASLGKFVLTLFVLGLLVACFLVFINS